MYKKDKKFCDVCSEETDYNGLVFMENTGERDLCKSHYLKYLRDKRMIESKKKFKNAKPCTKQWANMCKEQGEIFNKWFKEQKEVSGNSPHN